MSREGFKAPDEVWNQETGTKTFTNKFDFFPNTFKPEKIRMETVFLIQGRLLHLRCYRLHQNKWYSDGPDQTEYFRRGHMGYCHFVSFYCSFLQLGFGKHFLLGARNRYCLCSCRMYLFNLGNTGSSSTWRTVGKCCFKFCFYSTMGK